MFAAFQPEGWILDWLKQGLTPGVALAFIATSVLTWKATTDFARLRNVELAIAGIRGEMITKKDLDHTISELEARLENLAGERFLGVKDLQALNRTNGSQQDQINELRHHLMEHLGKGT